ncbi:acyl-CoA mutase large subunit family protein [Brevibacillus parabrevis]|uniref:methylmalonyl-CoA mutase family protein n=1 Tax=Brevibacillus parabrevis TaxID=54914 RepID=UPI001C248627|nr:acyl-CoA mutase large subunit family protein [Brevibacillus parabrevis]
MNKDTLFTQFPVPTYEQWREAAEKSLKGAAFDAKLLTKTQEGIIRQPIYRAEDVATLPRRGVPGEAPFVRGTRSPLDQQAGRWEVCQEMAAPDAKSFHEAALTDLARGQTALHIVFDRAVRAGLDPDEALPEDIGKDGLSIFALEELGEALRGLNLEELPLFVQSGALGLPVFSLLFAHMKASGHSPANLRGCIGQDPVTPLLVEGQLPHSLDTAFAAMAKMTSWASQHAPKLKTILVQGNPYCESGGHAVAELAFSLATGVEYIQAMLDRGLSIEEVAGRMQFSFAVGSDVFMEIAKLRAVKMLWANIVDAYGGSVEAQKIAIHARTAAWTKTVCDPYVNMLRATTEAFSAIVGGVDSLHVSAFDEAIRPANEFSRRIARNTQIILEQEAHLAKVADPAGGSWYVEWLTDELAKKAWELFVQVEEQGGLLRALESGFVQETIAQTAARKQKDIQERKSRIVGTNMYPNLAEQLLTRPANPALHKQRVAELRAYRSQKTPADAAEALEKLAQHTVDWVEAAAKAALDGATVGDIAKALTAGKQAATVIAPLRVHRAAEAFETLRKQAEAYAEKTGQRPSVFLAALGPVAKHKARADFAAEFFAVGGFAALRTAAYSSAAEAAQAAIASGARITVICSDDASYPELVPPLAQAIKQAAPDMTVLLAGLPDAEQLAQYKAAGVDDCIHLRSNCYQMLRELQERTGVSSR